jgi:hypothetical protein
MQEDIIFSKISIIYFNLGSLVESVVRTDYYDGGNVCEQISKWLKKKFPTSILVMKSPNNESYLLKRKFSPFT